MKQEKIIHQIKKGRDYFGQIFIGGLWILICLGVGLFVIWAGHTIMKQENDYGINQHIILGIVGTLGICYSIWQGHQMGFFDEIETEEVVHVIK